VFDVSLLLLKGDLLIRLCSLLCVPGRLCEHHHRQSGPATVRHMPLLDPLLSLLTLFACVRSAWLPLDPSEALCSI
jgi:hypothetical protein